MLLIIFNRNFISFTFIFLNSNYSSATVTIYMRMLGCRTADLVQALRHPEKNSFTIAVDRLTLEGITEHVMRHEMRQKKVYYS